MSTTKVNANKNKNAALQEQLIKFIRKENASHQVVIWSKSYCPHCKATKALFQSLPNNKVSDVQIHDLDVIENGSQIQYHLKNISGSRTVPVVFVNNRYIGGNSDVQKLQQEGKLDAVLQQEPAEATESKENTSKNSGSGGCALSRSANKWTNEFLFIAESLVHRFD
ncbi:MAG: hypothetical protein SGILL_000111 [Bacillariaceae sp.]